MDSSNPAPQDDENALELQDGNNDSLEGGGTQSLTPTPTSDSREAGNAPAPKPKRGGGLKAFVKKFNIYLLLFILILMIAGGIIAIAFLQNQKSDKGTTLKTQTLTQNTLNQVANSDASVGNTQQVLSIQSSAVFAGKVLVRQDLEVAGNLQIGGTVGLTNLAVGGSTQLGQTQISKDLSVAGNSNLQGTVSIAKSLQVSGNGSFGGSLSAAQISTSNLQLSSDLTLTHHLIAGGATPSRNNGSGLGTGGITSVSGSDSAGTLSVNIGSAPAAGCFATVNFTQKYNNTPHVMLTPVGQAGGGLSYYVTRTVSNFSVCVSTPAPAGSSFAFDYFVIE